MLKLFTKKKRFAAACDLSRMPLDRESTYALSTAQIISSRKFWDNIMTEPETMTYTEAHFKTGDETATSIRNMIFKKYAGEDKAWFVSDSQMHLFDVDEAEAKELANQWWDSEGKEVPGHLTGSVSAMDRGAYEAIKAYATKEAGRQQVKF